MTNLFGQGSNRGLLGRGTDYLFNRVLNYDRGRAIDNAGTRVNNVAQMGGSGLEQLSAIFAPNRTATGNQLYNVNPMVAGTQTTQAAPGSPTGTIQDSFTGAPKEGDSGGFEPIMFQGQLYTDPNAYYAAREAAIESEYQRQLTEGQGRYATANTGLDRQLEDLLYGFTNNLQTLLSGQDKALQSQQGYFSAISPDAEQSQQQVYAQQTRDETARGQSDLERQKSRGETQISEARTANQAGQESFINDLGIRRQELLDEVGNIRLDLASGVKGAAAQAPEYNTTDVLNNLAGLYFGNLGRGNTEAQARSSVGATLGGLGLPDKDRQSIEQYLYGQFINQVAPSYGY